MKQPQRTQPSRTARPGPNALSLTSPQSALCDVPQVLERSTRNLADVKKCTGAVTGPGVLVKLYPVGDLWIVGPPHTKRWIPSKVDDMRTANANAETNDRTKASQPAKSRSVSSHKAKAQLFSEKAARRKHQGSRARRSKKVPEQQVQEAQDESDPMNTEPEGEGDEEEEDDTEEEDAREGGAAEDAAEEDTMEEDEEDEEDEDEDEENAGEENAGEENAGEENAGEENAGEENAGEGNAGEENAAEENPVEENEEEGKEEHAGKMDAGKKDAGVEDMDGDLDESEEGKDLDVGPEKDAVMDKENGDDFEEQDDGGHSEPPKEAETAEADEGEDEEYGSEDDLAGDERAKRQQEAEGQREAEKEVDEYGEETTSVEAQMHNKTTGDDNAIQVGQREQHGDDEDKGSVGVHGEVRDEREVVEQRVPANYRSGAWRSLTQGYANGREEETRGTTSEGGEKTIELDDGAAEGKRKRALEEDGAIGTSTLEDYPNKRNKSTREEGENDAAVSDSFERGLETPPRPRTPSRMSHALSPGSTIKIVRQTSVVPGLQDTENAVRDAAQRDAIFTSLSEAHQKNLLSTALCLGSEEGIEELRCFVSNARMDGKQGSNALMSRFNNTTPVPDARSHIANNAPDPQSRYLAQISKLYRRLDDLKKNETLVIITKRASLATLAQCRESLVPKGVGGNRARDANLKLFRAIFPQHATVEKPEDRVTNFAASRDWIRLRNRLQEGRAWLEVRERFGGPGAFLALPPQCVPDSHVSKIPAKNFATLLRLFDVAWRALDDRARRTMDALVSFAIEERPLPETTLELERSDGGIDAATAGLSSMLAGWTVSDLGAKWSDDSVANFPGNRRMQGQLNSPQTPCTTGAATDCEEVPAIAESSVRDETMLAVDGGLFENVDFDEPLSQQI